ncbi:S49 family peptidase [Telmatospirillum siberiense]|uniref:Signal peptide peptidase SppA n=1 Tax=Telmatospirillum siberiense TaxID=382514 RepID=A0A2N3PQ82_9PROT|nr:S49 family peptidase [Telmatospirillum siberiense]PKU22561.1 signal peptide peptidase SppA [Telmatospirillum siberiense]
MRLFGRIILVILAIIGTLTLALAGLGTFAALKQRPEPLPKQMALVLDLNAGVAETTPDGPFAQLEMGHAYVLKDMVESLDRAAHDPRVTALVARLDGGAIGMARAQEIRDAVLAFRKSNKRTVLFSSGLGESGNGTIPYYIASAFQEIWLQPSGDIGLTGFAAESPFFKGALDLLGVKAEFGARHEYKSAIEVFTQTKFTKESRESLQLLLDSWTRQATGGIAEGRGLSVAQVKTLIDRAPLLADEAKAGGLVDRLAYWDEVEKSVTGGGAKLVGLHRYEDRLQDEPNAVKIALIYGVGAVQRGEGDASPLAEGNVMSSERITKAFRDAAKDPEVKAILFRINSPGGSYSASDSIWREVGNARAAGKPVVVSMGDMAASGGYFAAMAADRIVAEPGTITGSIGVFMGKMVLADFWKKLGVSWDEIHNGQNATLWSSNSDFSATGWERANAILDHIYADFTEKAQQGRKLKTEDMDKLARGRIWPGDEAKRVGLVDLNGGYATAIVQIRELARLPSQMPVDLVQFPRAKQPLDYLLDMAHGRLPDGLVGTFAAEARIAKVAAVLKPLTVLMESGGSELRMAPIEMK